MFAHKAETNALKAALRRRAFGLLCPVLAGLLIAIGMQTQAFGQASLEGAAFQSLAGEARFHSGSEVTTTFADPAFDDSAWPTVTLPALINALGAETLHPVAWFRIRFTVDERFQDVPLAFVGFFHREYELYINGQKVDATPHFGIPGLTPWAQTSPGQFSAVALPPGLLNQDGENVLAIRFARIVLLEDAGVRDTLFGLTDVLSAAALQQDILQNYSLFEGVTVGINGLLTVFVATLLLLGFRDATTRWFAAIIGSYFFMMFYASHWAAEHGFQTPWTFRAHLLAITIVLVANIGFSRSLLGRPTGKVPWIIGALLVITISPSFGTYTFLSTDVAILYQAVCSALFLPLLIGPFLWIVVMALFEGRKGNPMGWYMLCVYGLFVALPVAANALNPAAINQVTATLGGRSQDVLVQLFMISLSVLFAVRLLDIEKQRVLANDRARRAQAQERQRVARDLHDSVGQWLSSVKLRLQTIGAEVQSGDTIDQDRLNELVGDMDVLIDDTRRIARDLSPSATAYHGLHAALHAHATYLQDDHGVDVALDLDDAIVLPAEQADHVYRIVQEATSNAITHGSADTITIALAPEQDSGVLLSISDNGTGFDAEQAAQRHSLGLASIRERAAMMDGRATIESTTGQGTRIAVSLSCA